MCFNTAKEEILYSIIIEFYGLVNKDDALIPNEIISISPAYILLKLKHGVNVEIVPLGLPPTVIGNEPISLTYNAGH
jgi:hypothetical protein